MADRAWTQHGATSTRSSEAVLTRGYLEGGPELAHRMAQLEKGLRDELLATVTKAGGDVFAAEWRRQILSKIGRGPGVAHYADAVDTLARPGKNGATAVVGLRQVETSPGEAQPTKYATRWEFGSTKRSLAQFKSGRTLAGRERGAVPTLRPAFEAVKGKALDEIAVQLQKLIDRAVP